VLADLLLGDDAGDGVILHLWSGPSLVTVGRAVTPVMKSFSWCHPARP
jgi:hypothetical protein